MANVVLHNLAKTFANGCRAVRDLNLEVHDGELLVLVGPSGCGKSTTLRMIAGLEQPTAGDIRIGDRLMNDVAPADRDVAMVFQNYALYPHLNTYENIAFGLKMRRTPAAEIRRRVDEAAAWLSLEPLLPRMPRELSGGERQRVALGRAIVRQPKVFLFDEPLSNLDAHLRTQLRSEIARLHKSLGTTMFYVTHDQEEAMLLGQRLVVMDRGLVQQVAAPLDVYRRPATHFVASFIGSPPMNFMRGQIHSGTFRFSADHELPPLAVPSASRKPGPALLGIRPEDIILGDSGHRLGDACLNAVERLGHETVAYFELAGNQFAVRLPADANVTPGEQGTISIRAGAYHLFCETDGHRLN
jgi:ABC-type sugar transport system ATPase subunit